MRQLPRYATQYWLWGLVLAVAVVVFWASPGGYGGTARAVLHGLCAQTPTHTLSFGERLLPFDARMTGIYGGFLVAFLVILASGRMLSYGSPPTGVVVVLSALVTVMALDGFNSLLSDLNVWHLYAPSNGLRIVTGFGTGVSLAVALCWLLSSSLWGLSSPGVAIRHVSDLRWVTFGFAGYAAILALRPEWLHMPVSLLLVASAWLTVSILMLVVILLALGFDASIRRFEQLHVPVAMAALLAISVMLGLAGARFWLEHTFGISNAMM